MDELKDKIILAVKETIAKNVVFATGDYLYAEIDYDDVDHIAEQVADTLIAANIGDITAWKERAEKHRVLALPGGRIKQLYSNEEVEQIAKERDELKERADSEIKSCYKEIAEKRDEIAKLWKQLKRAQNAAKKQKHCAEVADRALMYAVSKYRCDECPNIECNGEIRGSLGCIERICAEYKKQAEKELAEVKE